jgi:hypothetical protein
MTAPVIRGCPRSRWGQGKAQPYEVLIRSKKMAKSTLPTRQVMIITPNPERVQVGELTRVCVFSLGAIVTTFHARQMIVPAARSPAPKPTKGRCHDAQADRLVSQYPTLQSGCETARS